MRRAAIAAMLLFSACTYDYASLAGRASDGGGDGGPADGPLQPLDGRDGATPDSGDTTLANRPLGAGCNSDDHCVSGICAPSSNGPNTCCTGRPDACNSCVGGYVTSRSNGLTPDGCAICTDGRATPQNEDKSCGAVATCGGPMFSSGFGDGSGLYSTVATNFTCRAGFCVPAVIDCTIKACPDCNKQYLGCFVDSPGSGSDIVSGAACRCVDKSGSFCSGSL